MSKSMIVSDELHKELEEYCDKNNLKIGATIEEIIKKFLIINNKKNTVLEGNKIEFKCENKIEFINSSSGEIMAVFDMENGDLKIKGKLKQKEYTLPTYIMF